MPVRCARILCLALSVCLAAGVAQAHNLYLVNENHTDYGWNATTDAYDQSMLSELDYYLGQIAATAGNPPEEQARFVADCWWYLYLYEKNRTPAQFQTLINRIGDGHITVPLNPLVELYGALPTEAAIRAGYYPGRIERRYGVHFRHGEEMENQTIPWGLSSLWLGSGALYSWKGICGCVSSAPYQNQTIDAFRWRGPDNLDVLMKWYAYSNDNQSWGGYSENRRSLDDPQPLTKLQQAIDHFKPRGQTLTGLFGYGWDDVTSQTTKVVDTAVAWNNAHPTGDHAYVSNVVDYFAELEGQRNSLPILRGGWGNDWDLWPTALAERTAKTRRAIERLRTAEALAAVVHWQNPAFWTARQPLLESGLIDYFKYFEHSWSQAGVGLQYVINNKFAWSNSIDQTVAQLDGDAGTAMAGLFSTPNEDRFAVFNPLAAARTDVADLAVTGGPYIVTDVATAAQVPSQIITRGGNTYLRILASNVPSLGYRVYRYTPGTPSALPNAATVTIATAQIENSRWRITVGTRGQLTSTVDKANANRELVLSSSALNDFGSGASSGLSAENVGPVSATILRTISGSPTRTVRVTLFAAGVDRIGIENEITANSSALQTYTFGTNLSNPQIRFEEVGAVARPGLTPTGDFLPGTRADYMTLNHFVDLAEASYHVTLSSWDAFAMQIGNSTTSAFTLPTSTVRVLATGNPSSSEIVNQGGDALFRTQLALFGRSGAYSGPQAMQDSLAHQNPLRTIALGRNQTGPLAAATSSFLSVSAPNVLVTAFKPAEEGNRGLIVRVWELAGTATNFTINASAFNPSAAFATSLIETDTGVLGLAGGVVSASIGANQMKTFRLALGPLVATPTPTTTAVAATASITRTATVTMTRTPTRTATRTGTASATRSTTATATALPPLVLDPIAAPIVVGATTTLTGGGFSPGSVIIGNLQTGAGVLSLGPDAPQSWTPTQLAWAVSPSLPLGQGFAVIAVVNTDQGYRGSSYQSQRLYGNPALNIPTLLSINGNSIQGPDATVIGIYVNAPVFPDTDLTLGGTGFNAPGVNLYSASGNIGPLFPVGASSPTQLTVHVPAGAPLGLAAFEVVNSPYAGNVGSQVVYASLGSAPTITSVTQNGSTVTVNGSGFAGGAVINLFNQQGQTVVNLGGVAANGQPRIPLTIVSPARLTFQVPAAAVSAPAYVQVINPPFIGFTSTGNDPDGGFTLAVP